MKKALLLLCVLIGFSPLFANGGEELSQGSGGGYKLTPPGTFPVTEEPFTIKVMAARAADIEDLSTNSYTLHYEEMTNIHVDWDQIPAEQKTEKLNIIMASGDYPDVITGGGETFSRTQLLVYGSQGIFLPLNDVIENQMVHLPAMFAYNREFEDLITAPDGKIYAFPQVAECFHCTSSVKMWVYEPWLEALGLDAPETLEDFREMLIAFRDNDPNGNGLADEVPLAGAINGWNSTVEVFIMNSFIYTDKSNLMVDEGIITFVPSQKEWKEGLKYLNSLYKEELIAAETFTQSSKQLKQLAENPDTPILGAVPFGSAGFTVIGGESGRYLDYKTIKPLIGPSGERSIVKLPYRVDPTMVVTSNCTYPDVVARWLDYFYTFEGVLEAEYGLENDGWIKAPEGTTGINGEPARWKPNRDWGQLQNMCWVHTVPFFNSAEKRQSVVSNPKSHETILYTATKENYHPYKADKTVPKLFFDEAAAMDLSQIEANIKDYVTASTARFIIGDLDIDKDWDSYLSELKTMGVDRYVTIFQNAYDLKYKK